MKSVLIKAALVAAVVGCFGSPHSASASDLPMRPAPDNAISPQQYANFLPPLETLAQPGEQTVLNSFLDKVRAANGSSAAVLGAADEALAKLTAPTKLRGMIEYDRAVALANLSRNLDALDAAEKSVELLPGYSAPLIKAFTLNAYLNRTAPATEYLMRAITVDPTTARTIDDYEINNLLRRLQAYQDDARARAISDRLLQIGWIGNRLGSQSHLAVDAIKRHIADGDVAGARAIVPKLLVPGDARELLMMNSYAAIWPDIEAWAGPQLERAWPIYLDEARSRWEGARTARAARDYLAAMMAAGRYEEAVHDILPLFNAPAKDVDLIFIVAPLGNSLAQLGRWDEADALYARAEQTWAIGSNANALNVSANHALLLLEEGHPAGALAMMDKSLADARHWGPEVGQTPLASMEHSRACMLHELGRDTEARVAMTEALAIERGPAAAMLHLCLGDPDAAKRALRAALLSETTREDVVRFMQLPDELPGPGNYDRKQRAAADALRADPELRAAVTAYGRILPWRTNEAVNNPVPALRSSARPPVVERRAGSALNADERVSDDRARTRRSWSNDLSCTKDGLIHAGVSQKITRTVTDLFTLVEPGARVRDVAKLELPCGFQIDERTGWNVVLTNGREVRRYVENNPFGFAPAYGFNDQTAKSYTLNFRSVSDGEFRRDGCIDRVKPFRLPVELCSSFGNAAAFFGMAPDHEGSRIAHYVVAGLALNEDFVVAKVNAHIANMFFLPPPDAPGGTITLIITNGSSMYRAFLDTPKG